MSDKIRLTLQIEGGITQHSLENAEYLTGRFGVPYSLSFYGDSNQAEYNVIAAYKNGHSHVFTGFSWGYSGEGPRGLHHFLNHICKVKVPMDYIASADDENFAIRGIVVNSKLGWKKVAT